MSTPRPFQERFTELMAETLLRHGMLGCIPAYASSFYPDPHAYKVLGIRGELDEDRNVYPSLRGARCPKCKAHLKVVNVQENIEYVFGGTDVPADAYRHGQGTLRCPRHPEHLTGLVDGYGEPRVVVNDTLYGLIGRMGAIAD